MKKFFKKKWVQNTLIVIVAVFVCGFIFNLDFDANETFSVKLNEDNLFFEQIEDGEIYDNLQVTVIADNGAIKLDGEIADSSATTIDLSESIDLGEITLKPGTYTFSCFKNPNWKSHYAVGTYTIAGTTYTWYADFEKAPNNAAGAENLLGRTITLEEEVTVSFEIRLVEGAKLDNVTAKPVLVEGEEIGSYFANAFLG